MEFGETESMILFTSLWDRNSDVAEIWNSSVHLIQENIGIKNKLNSCWFERIP